MNFIAQSNPTLLAVSKPPLLALLTNSGSSSTSQAVWSAKKIYKANETLVDVITCRRFMADPSGGVQVQVVGGMPQVSHPLPGLNRAKRCRAWIADEFCFVDDIAG